MRMPANRAGKAALQHEGRVQGNETDDTMGMNKLPIDRRYVLRASDKYCAAALVCLSLAIFVLSVVEFLVNPASPPGIVFASIGVLLMCCTIFFFARYRHALIEEEGDRS